MSHKVLIVAGLALVLLVTFAAPALAALPGTGHAAPAQMATRLALGDSSSIFPLGGQLDGDCEIPGACGCPPPK